jgi:hypothetical protein
MHVLVVEALLVAPFFYLVVEQILIDIEKYDRRVCPACLNCTSVNQNRATPATD